MVHCLANKKIIITVQHSFSEQTRTLAQNGLRLCYLHRFITETIRNGLNLFKKNDVIFDSAQMSLVLLDVFVAL